MTGAGLNEQVVELRIRSSTTSIVRRGPNLMNLNCLPTAQIYITDSSPS